MPVPRTARFWIVRLGVAPSLPIFINVAPVAALLHAAPISLAHWGILAIVAFAVLAWRASGTRSG
ncbi:MAG TPA: hypothetical protein VJ376_13750 [Pseudomonadota bacterium]|nr:hypothetical protein [Pseudomonadota bacterium]